MVIHGGIDGHSRLIVYLCAATNNKAEMVETLFFEATLKIWLAFSCESNLGE